MGRQERANHRDLDETRKTVKSGKPKKILMRFQSIYREIDVALGFNN